MAMLGRRNESKGGADAVRGGRREAASLNCVSSARASAFTFSKAALQKLQHVAALWRCGKLFLVCRSCISCLQAVYFLLQRIRCTCLINLLLHIQLFLPVQILFWPRLHVLSASLCVFTASLYIFSNIARSICIK